MSQTDVLKKDIKNICGIEIEPKYVEIWDTSDEGYAFQLFIDFENKTVEPKIYDQK